MRYVDTSLLVAALLNEKGTPAAQRWLSEQPAGELAISDWVITEFSAALSMKLRTGELQPPHRVEASLHVLPVSRLDFQTAARYSDQYLTGLRAGDALHLAIASNYGASLHTLDKRLAEAGQVFGVDALLLAD